MAFYKITPLDTLFFRGAIPFGAEEDLISKSFGFPPAPSNLYGAIKSLFFRVLDNKDIDFSIKQIFYQFGSAITLPLPTALLQKKGDDEKFLLSRAKLTEIQGIIKNNIKYLLVSSESDYKYMFDFIDKDKFTDFLKGEEFEEVEYEPYSKAITSFFKPGIKRFDTTKNVDAGKFFSMEGFEFNGVNFIVELDIDIPGNLLKLGGESKIALIEKFARPLKIKTGVETDRLLIYFATPTVFRDNPNLLKILGLEGELLSYSIGKFKHIGGFDIVSGEPKIMYKFIPEGSIFLYELKEKIKIDELQGKKLIDTKIEDEFLFHYNRQARLSKQGFGITYFGTF